MAAVGTVGTYLLGLWPGIASWLCSAWNWLFRATSVSNWLLTLLSLLAMAILLPLGFAARSLLNDRETSDSHWSNYTEDKFFGLCWRWKYGDGEISNLYTFCPYCDYQVFFHVASPFGGVTKIGFHCDSCGRNLGEFDESYLNLESKTRRFIQRKLRNGTWITQKQKDQT